MDFVQVIGLYEHFYSKVYHCDYTYKPSKHDKIIKNFIEKLDISCGQEWMFDYIAFQFEYWSKIKYKKVKGTPPNLVFGKVALERFEQRNENWKYFTDQFVMLYQIGLDNDYKKDLSNISTAEEKEKLRFTGKERLANCILYTTLYNRKSKICVLCGFSKVCKEVQKVKYLNIYQLRGNETGIKKESTEKQVETGSIQEI